MDAGGQLYAEELLLRLDDGDRVVAAGEFIETIAIYPNLASRIDWWVIENVFKRYSNAQHKKHINVSGGTLSKKGLSSRIKHLAGIYGCDIKTITVEITEQLRIENYQEILMIRAMGVDFSIDDFLTGHNSLRLLQNLHPHTIKIPGALTSQLSSQIGMVLTDAIIQVAASLSISAIAESVECEHTWTILKLLAAKHDCKLYGQGYLFGHPKPCEAFT